MEGQNLDLDFECVWHLKAHNFTSQVPNTWLSPEHILHTFPLTKSIHWPTDTHTPAKELKTLTAFDPTRTHTHTQTDRQTHKVNIRCVCCWQETLHCGIQCFLCVSDRCKRMQIYIRTRVQMGLNIYMTVELLMPGAISDMVCILRGLSRFMCPETRCRSSAMKRNGASSLNPKRLKVKESSAAV